MRQIATLPSADKAHTLADYLLTLKIDTRLEKESNGWAVWVLDEDHLSRARQELEEFTRNPADSRYQAVAQTANHLRQRQRQQEHDYQRRQARFDRQMKAPVESRRWTIALIVVSVVISLLSRGGHDSNILQALSIASYEVFGNKILWLGLADIAHGQVWRLVTPIFLHFGILHLFFDMVMLYILGGAIERRRGALRYLTLVFVVAAASNLFQYYLGHPSVIGGEWKFEPSPFFGGMSGVDYGLFGYLWMKARFQPKLGLLIDPRIVILMVFNLLFCMTPFAELVLGKVANGAHVGGFLIGLFLGYIPTLWSGEYEA